MIWPWQDAGYPHITSVGSYKLHGESVLELMEINDPKWDLRLHQFPLQGLKTKLPLVRNAPWPCLERLLVPELEPSSDVP